MFLDQAFNPIIPAITRLKPSGRHRMHIITMEMVAISKTKAKGNTIKKAPTIIMARNIEFETHSAFL